MDIQLDTNNDLLIVDGDLVLVDGNRDEVIQELNIRLNFFLGEWFLDVTAGIPYFQTILKKGTSIQTVNGIFIREINAVEEVNDILDFQATFDGESRVYRVDFKVDTIYGIITGSEEISI